MTNQKSMEFSCGLSYISINRKWVDYTLFDDTELGIKGYKAGTWPVQYVVEGVVVARDINITGATFTDDVNSSMSKIKAGGGISYCGFGGASGNYSKTEGKETQKTDKEKGSIS